MKRKQDVLILQGGGALGAYELGAIKRLYELPDFQPEVVTGVSIGALNAAVLIGARNDNSLAALEALWEELIVQAPWGTPDAVAPYFSIFGNPGLYRPRWDYFNYPTWTNYYDTAPMRTLLHNFIDFDKLNYSAVRIAITALNVRTGRIQVFQNSDPAGAPLTADHIIASSSLPPSFSMTRVAGNCYWDGGLFDNTPLAPAIALLDDDPNIHKRLFIVKLFPTEGSLPLNMMDVADRILEITFASKLAEDMKTARRINDYVDLVQRIDGLLDDLNGRESLKEKIASIRQHPGYARLQQYMALEEVISIENENPEIASAAFDFSRQRIHERIAAGYRDADKVVKKLEQRMEKTAV